MIIVDSKAFNRAKEKNPHANHFMYFRHCLPLPD